MFGHFIYFIIAVLIYSTYQPPKEPFLNWNTSFLLFNLFLFLYTFICIYGFQIFERRLTLEKKSGYYDQFDKLVFRLLTLALIIYSFNIYGLNLKYYLNQFDIFIKIPTLSAILFLGLFTLYFAILWIGAYRAYVKLFQDGISMYEYVTSNITFSVPVLLPWLFISGITDLILFLPFQCLHTFLNSTVGMVTYFIIFLLFVALFAPLLIQKSWRCKPLPESILRSRIEAICQKANVKYADILFWPIMGGKMITAGVMGLIHWFRYILVTKALINSLTYEELDAVIAHEVGHIKKKHLVFYLFFFSGFLIISYFSMKIIPYILIAVLPIDHFLTIMNSENTALNSIIYTGWIIIIFIVYFRYIFGYFMRNFERQADIFVFPLLGNGLPLITSLQKVAFYSGCPPEKKNWHHFSIEERISYISKCQSNSIWIDRHHKKLRISFIVYWICLLIIGIGIYNLEYGKIGQSLHLKYSEKLVQYAIQQSPDTPSLYMLLGEIALSDNNYKKAIQSYEYSLLLNPDNADVLNNLSWIYATCKDKAFRNNTKALEYAQKAASLNNSPYILDTLAESFYVNGHFQDAVRIGKNIMTMELKDPSYHQAQLNKFMAALKENH